MCRVDHRLLAVVGVEIVDQMIADRAERRHGEAIHGGVPSVVMALEIARQGSALPSC